MASLVKEATANGVKFGIWVGPEMVNPKSELYETNPDWVIRQPRRAEHYFRNQLVLDLSNPEVQDFVFSVMNRLFSENPDLALQGKLGFDIVISELSDNDLVFCQAAVKNYNDLKGVVWHGDQYRLVDPKHHNMAATMVVNDARTQAVMFNYLVNNRYDQKSRTPVKLKGLDPAKKYPLKEVNLYPGTRPRLNPSQTYSGDFLMTVGINPLVDSSRQSVVLVIRSL